MDIVQFLLKNEAYLSDYFKKVQVNQHPVLIKAGGSEDGFNINFLITGELDKSITSFEDKIKALFNTNEESKESVKYLNDFTNEIKQPYTIIAKAPFLKIQENPVLHAFRFSVREITE